jgi:hypothetical protein
VTARRGRGGAAGLFAEAGRQIARMHAAGVAHPDLNLRNLLVVAGEDDEEAPGDGSLTAWVIDFDRARLFDGPVPPERRAADLARLGDEAGAAAGGGGLGDAATGVHGHGLAFRVRNQSLGGSVTRTRGYAKESPAGNVRVEVGASCVFFWRTDD